MCDVCTVHQPPDSHHPAPITETHVLDGGGVMAKRRSQPSKKHRSRTAMPSNDKATAQQSPIAIGPIEILVSSLKNVERRNLPRRKSEDAVTANANASGAEVAPESYLLVAEVARRHRVTPKTVRNWIAAKQLPALRKGRLIRIPLSGLKKFEKGR